MLGVPLAWAAVRWVVVASTTAVTIGVCNYRGDFGQDVGSFVFDLMRDVVFLSALIAGPALLGTVLGRYVLATRAAGADR